MQNTSNTTLPLEVQMEKGIEELKQKFDIIDQIEDIIRLKAIEGWIWTFYRNKEGAIKYCPQLRQDLLNIQGVDNIIVNETDLSKYGTTQEDMLKSIMNDQEIPVIIAAQHAETTTLTKLFETRCQQDQNIPYRMLMLKEYLKNSECLQIKLPNNGYSFVYYDENRGRFFCKYLLDINVCFDIIVDTNGKCTKIELPDVATLTDDNLKEKLSTFISSVNQYFQEHNIDLFNISDFWQVIYSPAFKNTEISKNYSNVKQYFEDKNKIQNEIIRRYNSVLSSNNNFAFLPPAGYSCLTNKHYPSIQDISQALKSYKTDIQNLQEKYLKAIDMSVEKIKKLPNISDIEVQQHKNSLSDVLKKQKISLDAPKFLFYTLSDNIVEMTLTNIAEKLILKLDKNFDVEYLEYKNDNTKETAKIYPNMPFYYKNKQHYLNNMCMFHKKSLREINDNENAFVNAPDQITTYDEFKSIQEQQMLWQRLLQNWNISSSNCVALNKNFKFNNLLKKIIINNTLGISVKEFNEILKETFNAKNDEEKIKILSEKSKEIKKAIKEFKDFKYDPYGHMQKLEQEYGQHRIQEFKDRKINDIYKDKTDFLKNIKNIKSKIDTKAPKRLKNTKTTIKANNKNR